MFGFCPLFTPMFRTAASTPMFGFCPLFTSTLLSRRAGSDVEATSLPCQHRAKQKIIMAGNCNAFAFREVVDEEIPGDWRKRDGLNYLHAKWKEIRRGERIAEGSGGEREREEGRRKFLKITLYLSLFLPLTIALFLSHAISPFLSLASVMRGARRASCNPLSCLLLPLSPSLSLSLSPPCAAISFSTSPLFIFFYLLSFFHLSYTHSCERVRGGRKEENPPLRCGHAKRRQRVFLSHAHVCTHKGEDILSPQLRWSNCFCSVRLC